MKLLLISAALILSAVSFAQSSITSEIQAGNGRVMVVAVAHDASMLGGGISSSEFLPPGIANVEPIAWITAVGKWIPLGCKLDAPAVCKQFDRTYLRLPHNYSVVSAGGYGTVVHVQKMYLDDECFGMGGRGKFSGNAIHFAAVAAEERSLFSAGGPVNSVSGADARHLLKAFANAAGKRLDTTRELRIFRVNLAGHKLFAFQRAFQDWASKPQYAPPSSPDFKMVFALGSMHGGKLQILQWKENLEDDNEQILGVIRLRGGQDFLVSSSNNPEGNEYRVYGYRKGKLVMIFQGGGGGC